MTFQPCMNIARSGWQLQRRFSSTGLEHLADKATLIANALQRDRQTVGVAETSSGGLISAALFGCPGAERYFRGAGIRLPSGISENASKLAKETSQKHLLEWGLEYPVGAGSESGTAQHALELAHAAKFNLGTDWGMGESGIAGPHNHPRTGYPAGMGFVAVVGPTMEQSGVLKISPQEGVSRHEDMQRFALAALDLMSHIQTETNNK
jgi:nicotinamide mononucleotide (NMN) deamidase PncC